MLKVTQIINEIETRLSQITTTNGYLTNIGNDIKRDWMARIISNEHRPPFIVIQDGNSEMTGYSGDNYVSKKEITLVAVVDDVANRCNEALHDLRRALIANDRAHNFGGLATRIEHQPADMLFEGSRVYISLPLIIQYSEKL